MRSHSRQVRELGFEPKSVSRSSLGSLHNLTDKEFLTLTSQGWHILSQAVEHYKMAPGRSGSRWPRRWASFIRILQRICPSLSSGDRNAFFEPSMHRLSYSVGQPGICLPRLGREDKGGIPPGLRRAVPVCGDRRVTLDSPCADTALDLHPPGCQQHLSNLAPAH